MQEKRIKLDLRILLQVYPKDVPVCYDFALLFHEQKKLDKYCSVIGYLLGNHLRSTESVLSFKNPSANLLWFNPLTDEKGWVKQ